MSGGILGSVLSPFTGNNGIISQVLSVPTQILGSVTGAVGSSLEPLMVPLIVVIVAVEVFSKLIP